MSVSVKDKSKIIESLERSLEMAESGRELDIPNPTIEHLNIIFENIDTATSGYLNLITCLTCASVDEEIDPRFHRKPGNGMPEPKTAGGWFSGRTVSEKIIYPWMEQRGFRTAKSGWQTRTDEVDNYSALKLRELESHQASDLRTGTVGDIELEDSNKDVIEGIEVKHNIKIDLPILLRAKEKIMKSCLKRYYILTTHVNCSIMNSDVLAVIREVYSSHGCQIIVNGVIPTIRYYLRICSNPSKFLDIYSSNITSQSNVTTEQLKIWQKLQKLLNA